MTQTSIPAGELASLHDQACDLHAAIAAAMDQIQNTAGPVQPPLWSELHLACQAANVAAEQLAQISRRQYADAPVPYLPAPVAACGHPAGDDGACFVCESAAALDGQPGRQVCPRCNAEIWPGQRTAENDLGNLLHAGCLNPAPVR